LLDNHRSKLTDEASFLKIQKQLAFDNKTEEEGLNTKESKNGCGSVAYVDVDSNDQSDEESSH